MHVCIYIHNKYTQYTHIYNVNKTFILDVINLLTALIITKWLKSKSKDYYYYIIAEVESNELHLLALL